MCPKYCRTASSQHAYKTKLLDKMNRKEMTQTLLWDGVLKKKKRRALNLCFEERWIPAEGSGQDVVIHLIAEISTEDTEVICHKVNQVNASKTEIYITVTACELPCWQLFLLAHTCVPLQQAGILPTASCCSTDTLFHLLRLRFLLVFRHIFSGLLNTHRTNGVKVCMFGLFVVKFL